MCKSLHPPSGRGTERIVLTCPCVSGCPFSRWPGPLAEHVWTPTCSTPKTVRSPPSDRSLGLDTVGLHSRMPAVAFDRFCYSPASKPGFFQEGNQQSQGVYMSGGGGDYCCCCHNHGKKKALLCSCSLKGPPASLSLLPLARPLGRQMN